jgi:hypothetical protein
VKLKLCVLLLGVSLMVGCSATARFYPVQGPLSSQTPLPVPVAKVTFGVNPGNISVVLGDGEVCKGRWAVVPRGQVPKGAAAANALTAIGMQPEWDTVYGPGFYVAHVLGTKYYAQVMATGNRGTVLNVEMYRPENVEEHGNLIAAVKGVAKDNKDNIYKLVLE